MAREWWLSEKTYGAHYRTPTLVRECLDGVRPSPPLNGHLHEPWVRVIERSAFDELAARILHLEKEVHDWREYHRSRELE